MVAILSSSILLIILIILINNNHLESALITVMVLVISQLVIDSTAPVEELEIVLVKTIFMGLIIR
jgi:hypothetical protein